MTYICCESLSIFPVLNPFLFPPLLTFRPGTEGRRSEDNVRSGGGDDKRNGHDHASPSVIVARENPPRARRESLCD